MSARRSFDVGDASVSIGHRSSLQHDFLCIFTVTVDGISTVYYTHLDSGSGRSLHGYALASYLIEHIRQATPVGSFNAAP
jgi:hypothetical protein